MFFSYFHVLQVPISISLSFPHGQTFKGDCSISTVHIWTINYGHTAGWVWVRGDSWYYDAVIQVETVKHGRWYLNRKQFVSMNSKERKCDRDNAPALIWNGPKTTCCNGGMGRDKNGWCELGPEKEISILPSILSEGKSKANIGEYFYE